MATLNLYKGELARVQITAEQQKKIAKLYKSVYKDFQKQMKDLSPDGTVSEQIRLMQLKEHVKQLKKAYEKLAPKIQGTVENNMTDTAQAMVDAQKDWLAKVGLSGIKAAYSYVPEKVVEMVATGQLYDGTWSLSGAIWSDINKKQSEIDSIVAQGIAANKSSYDLAKDLEKYVNPNARKDWKWSKVYPGTAKVIDYNAQRLARTMVSHAYQQSFEMTCKPNPFVTSYRWLSSGGERMCDICEERDGKIYDKDSLPLDHPQGMCTFEAVIEDNMQEVANRLADWAKGGDDPELDSWAMTMKSDYDPTPKFNDLQEKWLGKLGYSPDKMPATFYEFASQLSTNEQGELLKLAGTSWSNPHPYQAMEKWYNENLLSVKPGVTPVIPVAKPSAPKPLSNSAPSYTKWIETIKAQTEHDMLAWEDQVQSALDSSDIKNIKLYTGSAYDRINTALRRMAAGKSFDEDDYNLAQDVIKSMSRIVTDRTLVVRRGTDLGDLAGLLPGNFNSNFEELLHKSPTELNNIFTGGVFKYAGLTSTSSMWDRGFSGPVEMIFYVPEGVQGSSIMRISKYGTYEGELLLNADTKVRILSVEASDGHKNSSIRVYAEVVP